MAGYVLLGSGERMIMKYETIIEGLKKDSNTRITCGNSKWLYWDELTNEWVVCEQGFRKKKASILYRGDSETLAINILTE